MLVLSRHKNQKIVFPTAGITLSFIQVSAHRVRVGIDAPKEVPVLRGEIAEEMGLSPDQAGGESTIPGEKSGNQSRALSISDARLQRRLRSAAASLDRLAVITGQELTEEARECVNRVASDLKAIDSEAARVHERPAVLPGNKKRALIVDDNANEAKLLAGFLKFRDFDVSIAEDGYEALKYLNANRQPDVILLDMVMPRLDGPKTIRTIRQDKNHCGLKVFGLSGGTPEEHGMSLGGSDVDGWFQKPVDPEELVQKLQFPKLDPEQNKEALAKASEGSFDREPM